MMGREGKATRLQQEAMVIKPAGLEESAREEERDRRLRHRICFLLDVSSLCLFALFIIHLLPILVESKPTHPDWQGQFVDTLDRQALLAFLGFVLLHLAVFLNPKKQALRMRLRRVRHLAVIACLGFLLLIPLQLANSLQSFRALQVTRDNNAAEVTRLMQVRESIVRSKNSQDLDLRLQALTEPALIPEQKRKALPDLQTDLLRANDVRQAQLTALIKDQASQFSPLALMISRVASVVGWATAFAAGAVPWGSKRTLLDRFYRRSEAS